MGITVGKSYDLNAAEFFNATQILTPIQKQAVNDLVVDLKNYGVWTKMKAIYPMVGQAGVSSSFEVNLKDTNTFRGTFSGSWIFSSTGATGDGTSAYMNTNLIPGTILTASSTHLSYYSRTDIYNTAVEFGSWQTSYAYGIEFALARTNIGRTYATINEDSRLQISPQNTQAFFIASRTANNLIKMYRNSNTLATNSTTQTLNLTPYSLFLQASNDFGTTNGYSTKECAFASIGDGLTDTDASNLYTAVQRFQTTLGRQV
jgi:hypothetical protein